MAELKLSGNHLKGSRPILSFHKARRPARLACLAAARLAASSARCMRMQRLPAAACCEAAPASMGLPAPGWGRAWNLNTTIPSTLRAWAAGAQAFDEQPHLQLLKEMLMQAFATPRRHHKSKPFCDHVLAFSVADSRIWLRNYQARSAARPPLPRARPRDGARPRGSALFGARRLSCAASGFLCPR
jgi:hypothetical protein